VSGQVDEIVLRRLRAGIIRFRIPWLGVIPIAVATLLIIAVCFRGAAYAAYGILRMFSNSAQLGEGYRRVNGVGAASIFVTWFAIGLLLLAIPAVTAHFSKRIYIRLNLRGIAAGLRAFSCWQLAAVLLVLWVETKDMVSSAMLWLGGAVAAYLGFQLLKKGAETFALARRHMAMDVQRVLRSDCRSPILYLRSFGQDCQPASGSYADRSVGMNLLTDHVFLPSFWTDRRKWTFEEVLCKGLSDVAPVVAIGAPGERLPALGAVREYVTDDQWQDEVVRLMGLSHFTCLVMGSSEGLLWELEQLVNRGDPLRVLLIIPPSAPWDPFARPIYGPPAERMLPSCLPDDALAVLFQQDWRPVVARGRATIADYRTLARLMRKRIAEAAAC